MTCPVCGEEMLRDDLLFAPENGGPDGDGIYVYRQPDGSIFIQGLYDGGYSCGSVTIPAELITIRKCGHDMKVSE